MQMPPQHQLPPHQPHPSSQMPHTCLHKIKLPSLQVASMPTLSHTIASPVHPPPHPSTLAHSSNTTNLILAHKCLIPDRPCLHEIQLPSLQVASTPALSHTIASPVHPPPHTSALKHSSNTTNLILAHKCLILDRPCLHKIQLPSLQVASMPTLSHTIASPVHPPPHPSALAHSSNSTNLIPAHKCLIPDRPCLHKIQLPSL